MWIVFEMEASWVVSRQVLLLSWEEPRTHRRYGGHRKVSRQRQQLEQLDLLRQPLQTELQLQEVACSALQGEQPQMR
jgi:hypothetical protein